MEPPSEEAAEAPPAPPIHPSHTVPFLLEKGFKKSKVTQAVYHTDYDVSNDGTSITGYVNVRERSFKPAKTAEDIYEGPSESIAKPITSSSAPPSPTSSPRGPSSPRSLPIKLPHTSKLHAEDPRYIKIELPPAEGHPPEPSNVVDVPKPTHALPISLPMTADGESELRSQLGALTPAQLRSLLASLCRESEPNLKAVYEFSETANKLRVKYDKKDWNADFQKLLSQPDSESKFRKLYHLAHDFVYAAGTYAKIIISELLLPASEKTIQPAELGGVAGGTKFIVQNILFKFVLDFEIKPGVWMYGGDSRSDENAMKAASHELKGLMSYYSCNIKGLAFPLMAVIDYKGFRLLAISILPIQHGSICYGSSNAGRNVHHDNPEINRKMEEAAAILFLKAHYVNRDIMLSAPGDLEVHTGADGLYYLLDFARVFPPEGPDLDEAYREKRQVYYKLLRPELLRKYGVPLCSDAFTNWQKYDPERDKNNLEVFRATQYLKDIVAPGVAAKIDKPLGEDSAAKDAFKQTRAIFARKFLQVVKKRFQENKQMRFEDMPEESYSASSDKFNAEEEIIKLSELMHREGVNLRHMGLIRCKVKSYRVRQCLLTEMLARVIKDLLRGQMRSKMREVRVLSEEPFKEVVIRVFNLILGKHKNSASFWQLVKDRLKRKFKAALSKEEESEDPSSLNQKIDLSVLFRRLEALVGVKLSEEARSELDQYPDSFEFVQSDVVEVYPKVKHMNIVDYAEGMALYLAAVRRKETGPRERLRQLRLSSERFARAISTLPDSYLTLYQWGLALVEEAKLNSSVDAQKILQDACDKFYSALDIKPNFQGCWVQLGESLLELAKLVPASAEHSSKRTKDYFRKAAQAFHKALSFEDFFFDAVFKKVNSLHLEAVSQRYVKRHRSRQLHFGVIQLCEVIYQSIAAGKLVLLGKTSTAFVAVTPAAEALESMAQKLNQLASSQMQTQQLLSTLKGAALRAGARPQELQSPASPANNYSSGIDDELPSLHSAVATMLDKPSPSDPKAPVHTASEPVPISPKQTGPTRPVVPLLSIVGSSPLFNKAQSAMLSESKDTVTRSRSATLGTADSNFSPLRFSRDDMKKRVAAPPMQHSTAQGTTPTGHTSQPNSRGSPVDAYYGTETYGIDEKLGRLLRVSGEVRQTSPRKGSLPSSGKTSIVSRTWAKQKYFGLSEDEQNQLDFLMSTEAEVFFLWADSIIQYAASKKNDSVCESLFTEAADKLADAVKIDPMHVFTVSRRLKSLEEQARENRRLYFAVAEVCRVICLKNATYESLYKWATSLLNYAKLYQEDPVKHAYLRKLAAEKLQAALDIQADFFDSRISEIFDAQKSDLEWLLGLMSDCSALKARAIIFGKRVEQIDLNGCTSLSDQMLENLVDVCPVSKRIDLGGCRRLGDSALAYVAEKLSPTLKSINLASCDSISDVGISELAFHASGLEELLLTNCQNISDSAVIQILQNLSNLRVLDLERSKISSLAFTDSRAPVVAPLVHLSLNQCTKVEDDGVVAIARRTTMLQELKLNGCSIISDSALVQVVNLQPNLSALSLHSLYRITDSSVEQLLTALPNLEALELRNCKSLSWQGLASVFLRIRSTRASIALRKIDFSKIGTLGRDSDPEIETQERLAKHECIKHIAEMVGNQLEAIELAECNIPDASLLFLADHVSSKLRVADFSECGELSNRTVARLCKNAQSLELLKLNSCRNLNYEESIVILADSLRKLKCLELTRVVFPDEGVKLLATNLARMDRLVLANNYFVTDVSLNSISQHLTGLRHLSVAFCNKITDVGMIEIVQTLPWLVHINVDGCTRLSNKFLFSVGQHCARLASLVLARCSSISDPGVVAVAEGVPQLKYLDLSSVERLSDNAIISLARYQPQLEDLNIKNCPKITEVALSKLNALSNVRVSMEASQNKLFMKELSAKSRASSRVRSSVVDDMDSVIQARSSKPDRYSFVTPELRTKFETISRSHTASPGGDAIPPAYEPFTTKYPYVELIRGGLPQCDPANLERYLSEAEFTNLFRTTQEEFSKLPAWKQKQAKSQLRLF